MFNDKKLSKKKIGDLKKESDFRAYINNLKLFKESDFVIYVLDARNPKACRYKNYEELLNEKMLLVINKIDLVPRETAIGWYNYLKYSEKINTFALCSLVNCDPLCEFLLGEVKKLNISEKKELKIVITGLESIGKKTIYNHIKRIQNLRIDITEKWSWVIPDPDLVALGCLKKTTIGDSLINTARKFLERCSPSSLMDVFHRRISDEILEVIPNTGRNKRESAILLFDRLASNEYRHYTLPPAKYCFVREDTSELQKNAFKHSRNHDMFPDPFIVLTYTTYSISIRDEYIPVLHSMAEP